MKSSVTIDKDTVVEAQVSNEGEGKVKWRSLVLNVYPRVDTAMTTSIRFNTVSPQDLKELAHMLLELSVKMAD